MVTIDIKIPPATIRYLKTLTDMPKEFPRAVQRGLEFALNIISQNLMSKRLTGQGPFPPSEHRLGVRSGALRGSVFSRSVIQGNKVIGTIGIDKFYAPVHEHGAVIKAQNAPFLVFKIKGKTIRTRQVVIPERAPLRTEVGSPQSAKIIADEVADQIIAIGTE